MLELLEAGLFFSTATHRLGRRFRRQSTAIGIGLFVHCIFVCPDVFIVVGKDLWREVDWEWITGLIGTNS